VVCKYRLEDLPGASIPGSRMTKVLEQLETGMPLSEFTLEHLRKNGYLILTRYAKNGIGGLFYKKMVINSISGG
jgi:hypothetical protein